MEGAPAPEKLIQYDRYKIRVGWCCCPDAKMAGVPLPADLLSPLQTLAWELESEVAELGQQKALSERIHSLADFMSRGAAPETSAAVWHTAARLCQLVEDAVGELDLDFVRDVYERRLEEALVSAQEARRLKLLSTREELGSLPRPLIGSLSPQHAGWLQDALRAEGAAEFEAHSAQLVAELHENARASDWGWVKTGITRTGADLADLQCFLPNQSLSLASIGACVELLHAAHIGSSPKAYRPGVSRTGERTALATVYQSETGDRLCEDLVRSSRYPPDVLVVVVVVGQISADQCAVVAVDFAARRFQWYDSRHRDPDMVMLDKLRCGASHARDRRPVPPAPAQRCTLTRTGVGVGGAGGGGALRGRRAFSVAQGVPAVCGRNTAGSWPPGLARRGRT